MKLMPGDCHQQQWQLSDQAFKQICDLIYQKTGIVLLKQKKMMVYNRLLKRLKILQLTCFEQYVALLMQHKQGTEWQYFINALTTNLTAFFREAHHFDVVAQHAKANRQDVYRVWCTAVSTGEEAYSVAMVLNNIKGDHVFRKEIVASDINSQVLQIAQQGIYAEEVITAIPPQLRKPFLLKGQGDNQGYIRIHEALRKQIQFRQINLKDKYWPIEGQFDVIFCRNVMIYFENKMQQELLDRFLPLLKKDGLLVIGHSENICQPNSHYQLVERSIYQLKNQKIQRWKK
ncbi:CheR family methyltransferase [Arsenophonus apicola]|uniref:CheR family methyltransferase n=1 Tax=Arsenophonus apicola TaxID=2879119 RepID=UPI0038798925